MTSAPTVSQVERWRPEALFAVADGWAGLAARLRTVADALRRLDRGVWSGESGERGWARAERLESAAAGWAARFETAAAQVRRVAPVLAAAHSEFLELLAAVRADGHHVADDGTVTPDRAGASTLRVQHGLRQVAIVDRELARDVGGALAAPIGTVTPALTTVTTPAATMPAAAEIVAGWPTMSQDRIGEQVSAMSDEQRRRLVAAAPLQVGNTDGVPWGLRIAANRINIAEAIAAQRRILARPEDDKIGAALAGGFGLGTGIGSWGNTGVHERVRAATYLDPGWRAAAIAAHDRDAHRRIEFYRGLLANVSDPTGRSAQERPRQILAFDPARSSLIELHGDLRTADSLGVLVPGMNTTVLDSAANVRTARRFVAAGSGEVAMITYLGGPFPAGPDPVTGLVEAADPSYAMQMAPRLVAFSEDVDRTVDATGRHVPVTYLGHSYGGSILGTAERLGLTADRTVYVEAAGAGVGVFDESDWNNRNPDVQRYSMTAPGDPIAWVQGLPGGPHGADPDEMSGVWRLDTGRRLDGSVMSGPAAHSDVVNEPSDAWHNLLAVITGTPVRR